MEGQVRLFLELIEETRGGVVFTGAGISTESGIPDYRSPGTGMWETMDQSVVSLSGFMKNPENYYSYAMESYPVRASAEPNEGHLALARLEKKGWLRGVITQNVDGLHTKAGSENVLELHGSIRRVICLQCREYFPMEEAMGRVRGGENPPLCQRCGGILKPDAVFFGEPLPEKPWEKSVDLVSSSEVLIVAGSSLLVAPASGLPRLALSKGATLVIINLTETQFDDEAYIVIRREIGEFFRETGV
ncbi:MAG: Sir2 family NAD-dependent protein deacetylase [Candidatus Dadabacteria bacterium]|nr:Sir2 family NAD-dependent protein deacetylase [Candidatus Dadabacteria bacterium]MCY4262723.1 Sir2 family NAD-dependent protein deacetylase [Candidatus Dadabacteria bacterium]